MKTKRHQQVAPRHTSEQRFAPELHEQLSDELNAENARPNKEPTIPMPRYQLTHTSPHPKNRELSFTMTYHADNPSAAICFAHYIAERLNIQIDWHDKHTGRNLLITLLSSTDL